MSAAIDYWIECVAGAAEECGLVITDEQLQVLAESVALGHENYSTAFYSPPSDDSEANRLRAELKEEREKLTCPRCRGFGREVVYFADRVSISQCGLCRGKGRVHWRKLVAVGWGGVWL